MSNAFVLDPNVRQAANQLYNHLGLREKQCLLSSTDFDSLPIEVQKMHLLFVTSATELKNLVRQFLLQSQRSKVKGTLDGFLQQINKVLEELREYDWENEFDDLDALEDIVLALEDSDNKKRPLEENSGTELLGNGKKRKSYHAGPQLTTLTLRTEASSNTSVNGDMLSPTTTASTTSTAFTVPDTPLVDDHHFAMQYQRQLQQEKFTYPGGHVISSPPRGHTLLHKGSWLFQYELARFMCSCQIAWSELAVETIQQFIELSTNSSAQLHDAMMNWYSSLRISSNSANRTHIDSNIWKLISLERCSDRAWDYDESLDNADGVDGKKDSEQQQGSNDMCGPYDRRKGGLSYTRALHYSAKITIPDSKEETPTLQLQVPLVQASNRFFRKFGADRFLEFRLAKYRSKDAVRLHSSFILQPFLLMGRTFRFLFLKDDRFIMFATEGPGLKPITIWQVIDWHIPIVENWGLTTCKFASRMGLGYSNSIPSLAFEPDKVRYIEDVFANGDTEDTEACMTDGCGIISPSAMRKIMGSQQNDILPCAVQGRIGGAKGLWIVPPDLDDEGGGDWIEIRASQYKFQTGLPGADMKIDPLHYTFDLVKNCFCIYPSHLNTQFIQCIAAGGVPTAVFLEILLEHLSGIASMLSDNSNTALLRDWLYKTGGLLTMRRENEGSARGLWSRQKESAEDELDIGDDEFYDQEIANGASSVAANEGKSSLMKVNKHSGLPSNLYEGIVRLLDAGFDATNAQVAKGLTFALRALLHKISNKYRIEVQQSCTLMCIPDPTGVLKPNEVFLQLSNRRVDEKTGIHAGLIVGDILVARNPCSLKSDCQKVQAIDCPALRIYSDVIVFSIQGDRSPASKLGGGDYDGDIVFCCWDRRLVEPFTSSPVPPTSDRVKVAFEKDTTKVRDELYNHRGPEAQGAQLQRIFLNAPIYDGTLGKYENWRTTMVELYSFDCPDVLYLGQMCALLVDSPKQGLKIRNEFKLEDQRNYGGKPVPKWLIDKMKKTRGDEDQEGNVVEEPNRGLTTTMDYLHMTISKEIEKLVGATQATVPEVLVTRKDLDLAAPWTKAMETAEKFNDSAMKTDLETIRKAVEDNFTAYQNDVKEVVIYLEQRREIQRLRLKAKRFQNAMTPSSSITSSTLSTPSTPSPSVLSSSSSNHSSALAPSSLGDHLNKYNSLFEVEEYHALLFHQAALSAMTSPIFQFDVMANEARMIQSIKASYAYHRSIMHGKYSKYCYVVAYDLLCRIKADAVSKLRKRNGLSVSVAPQIYDVMSVDRRWIRREKEANKIQKQL